MKALGILHYGFAVLLLLIVAVLLTVETGQLGATLHASKSPELLFLEEYDDQVAGLTAIIILCIQAIIELFIGWSCRWRAKHPDKMLLTLILSGGSVLLSLISLFSSGFINVEWAGFIHSATLNTVTFLLALWIKRAYDRCRLETGASVAEIRQLLEKTKQKKKGRGRPRDAREGR